MDEVSEIMFEIEGIAPIKFDRYHGLSDPKTEEGYKKQAEEKVYRDEDENICIPAQNIKACMRLASSELGKRMDAKKNRQAIQAGVFITPIMLSLRRKDYDGIAEDLITRGKGDKVTRVITYRPFLKKWTVSGKMTAYGIPKGFIKQALELGGLKYGLCGHRPEFGRFIVKTFK